MALGSARLGLTKRQAVVVVHCQFYFLSIDDFAHTFFGLGSFRATGFDMMGNQGIGTWRAFNLHVATTTYSERSSLWYSTTS